MSDQTSLTSSNGAYSQAPRSPEVPQRIDVDGEFDFDRDDIAPKLKKVRYKGRWYLLKEAPNGAAIQYRNSVSKSVRLTDGKMSGTDGLATGEAALVAASIVELLPKVKGVDVDPDNPETYKEGGVTEGWVKSLPNRYSKPMFEWVKKYSDIGEEQTVESIDKQIADLKKLRSKIVAEREAALASGTADEEAAGPKDEPGATTG